MKRNDGLWFFARGDVFFLTKRPRKKIVAIQQTVFIGNKKCFATYFLSPIKSNPIILLLTIKCFTTSLFLIFCCRCFLSREDVLWQLSFLLPTSICFSFLQPAKRPLHWAHGKQTYRKHKWGLQEALSKTHLDSPQSKVSKARARRY